jgi:hypothetical protein
MSNKLYLHLANSHFSTSSLVSIYGIHLSHPEILLFIITCLFRLLLKWFSTRYSSLHFYQILERLCDPPGNLVPKNYTFRPSVYFLSMWTQFWSSLWQKWVYLWGKFAHFETSSLRHRLRTCYIYENPITNHVTTYLTYYSLSVQERIQTTLLFV